MGKQDFYHQPYHNDKKGNKTPSQTRGKHIQGFGTRMPAAHHFHRRLRWQPCVDHEGIHQTADPRISPARSQTPKPCNGRFPQHNFQSIFLTKPLESSKSAENPKTSFGPFTASQHLSTSSMRRWIFPGFFWLFLARSRAFCGSGFKGLGV